MTQRRTSQRIPFRNRNSTGWWIASYIERFEWDDEDRTNLRRRCTAWENTILVKATNRERAYSKAVARGRLGHGSKAWSTDKKHHGHWIFEGLTMLLPVYEDIEDGSEVLWRDHTGRTVGRIRNMIQPKRSLEAFDDSEPDRVA